MPTKEQQRQKLIVLLKRLFQLDQPDLDFGFYRIMHAKAEQITEFLDKDLLGVIEDAFGTVDESKKARLKTEYEQELKTAKEYGATDPENSPKVQEAQAKYEAALLTEDGEGEIYDHLYRFFERYYDNGDFISRRYYTRETSGKAAPFAIPYNGEEVKLVWANMDQYYIKTSEYFSNYTFDIMQTGEVLALQKEDSLGLFKDTEVKPRRVHFKIVDAAEGEHGNIKVSESEKRFFIIHKEAPACLDDNGELVVNFEYRPDPEKGSSQEGTWRERRNAEAVETVIKALDNLNGAKEYRTLLKIPAPTDKQKDRPLLAKYINQYTARNTMDYFIHKDLGNFMRRELDFYIKNEVMRLDDIENAGAPAVETYLAKLKVLRKIAGKLIDFLAQLEDFQKKLWLKKKFVVETNYCITLDRVPLALYPEIAANEAQREEWVRLFAIDEIKPTDGDLIKNGATGYSVPLTVEFLKSNPVLVLDTMFFAEDFKARLTAAIEDFDEQCDGLLIHSENFQALNLLQERYQEQVKCVHIDPPYNTTTSGFLYKNEYQHSSWIALMENRVFVSLGMLNAEASYMCHIDENEYENLFLLFEGSGLPNAGTVVWDKKNPMLGRKGIATQHEYVIWRGWCDGPIYLGSTSIRQILSAAKSIISKHGGVNDASRREFSQWMSNRDELTGGERAYRLLDDDGRVFQSVAMGAPEPRINPKFHIPLIHPITGKRCPVPNNGWSRAPETINRLIDAGDVVFGMDETTQPRKKVYLTRESKRQISSVIEETGRGKQDVLALGVEFPYCHPVSLYEKLLGAGVSTDGIILDYFAGSGTTGHAVINLNREDGGKRKYILVEMGDYFDTVLKPRIAKVVYSESWKSGKPMYRNAGSSHCFKCLRLESYEDALNNLRFDKNETRDAAIAGNSDLREDYMLHYLLDVETRGSQSLLNIDAFADPTAYTLKIKKPGSDEYVIRNVDLIETFNYLISLRVTYIDAPQSFTARFKRETDPEIPEDQETRLVIDGKMKLITDNSLLTTENWWFRKVEGWVPADAAHPNNGKKEKVLIVWRKLTGDMEKDNIMLDEWFKGNRISTRDFEFDTIYVNGSNNLPNLKLEGDTWKVRLIEEDFMKRMWDVEGV